MSYLLLSKRSENVTIRSIAEGDLMSEEEFNIIQFLKSAVSAGASDEHLKVGYAPYIRKNGFIKRTNLPVLTKEVLDSAVLILCLS